MDLIGADPDGIQSVFYHYHGAYGTGGTSGSVHAPFAQDDGTATITIKSNHVGGDKNAYTVVASQTLGPEAPVA